MLIVYLIVAIILLILVLLALPTLIERNRRQ